MAKKSGVCTPKNATKAAKTAGSTNRKRVMRGEKGVPGAGAKPAKKGK